MAAQSAAIGCIVAGIGKPPRSARRRHTYGGVPPAVKASGADDPA